MYSAQRKILYSIYTSVFSSKNLYYKKPNNP